VDMFHGDLIGEFGFGGPPPKVHQAHSKPCTTGSSFAPAPPSCKRVNKRCCSSAMSSGSGMPPRPGFSGSGLSWTQKHTSTGDMNKKQRLSTRRSHGVSSSPEEISARPCQVPT
jgi:hypothetical protein